ncbi:MAG: porin, partial [Phycisphaerales bacterium]
MSSIRMAGVLVAAVAVLAGNSAADEPQVGDELQAALDKIGQLEATVDRLNSRLGEIEAADGERWLSEERADQIRGVVMDVLADAEGRTSFQSDAAVAGYAPGKGFYVRSADGKYSMQISGQLQVRYILNDAGRQSTEYGFQIRRAKIAFSGNIFDETWTYKIQGAFNRGSNNLNTGNTANFLVEDAWIEKDFGDGLSMKLGQFKAPWLQEDLVSSRRQLAVERSLLAGYFQQNYDRGIEL